MTFDHPWLDLAHFLTRSDVQARICDRLCAALRKDPVEFLGLALDRVMGRRVRAHNRLNALLGSRLRVLQPDSQNSGFHEGSQVFGTSQVPAVVLGVMVDASLAAANASIATTLKSMQPFRRAIARVSIITPALVSDDRASARGRGICRLSGWSPSVHATAAQALHILLQDTAITHVLLVRAGHMVNPEGIRILLAAARSSAHVVYGDECMSWPTGSLMLPLVKGAWDEEQFMATGFAEACVLVNAEAARRCDGMQDAPMGAEVRELLLRLAHEHGADRIIHMPTVISRYHPQTYMPLPGKTREQVEEARMQVAASHLARSGACAELALQKKEGAGSIIRIRRKAGKRAPLATIVVPTRDRLDLLQPCISSIRQMTRHVPYQILVVDNGSIERQTLDWLREQQQQGILDVLRDDGPFNFSRLNNRAACEAQGDILVFLNNDTEVLAPDWLQALLAQAMRPEVGAVGAKLLYPNGTVQHAGVCVDMKNAPYHVHQFMPSSHPGYMHRLRMPQRFLAVTAACMAVQRRKFLAVGGFDEKGLPVTLNDIDLCLKLEQRGWQNIWEPAALLLHKESASRARDRLPSQRQRWLKELRIFRQRWQECYPTDPYCPPQMRTSGGALPSR